MPGQEALPISLRLRGGRGCSGQESGKAGQLRYRASRRLAASASTSCEGKSFLCLEW